MPTSMNPCIAHEVVCENLIAALSTGKYSDLTITCSGQVFEVHRVVVCLQSKVLAAHIDRGFKESTTGIIDLPDDEPEIISKMVDFMYKGSYTDYTEGNTLGIHQEGRSLVNAKLYVMGDKYDIPALKKLAKDNFHSSAEGHSSSVSFQQSLTLMYEELPESDRGLKDVALNVIHRNWKSLRAQSNFHEFLNDNEELHSDLSKTYWLYWLRNI